MCHQIFSAVHRRETESRQGGASSTRAKIDFGQIAPSSSLPHPRGNQSHAESRRLARIYARVSFCSHDALRFSVKSTCSHDALRCSAPDAFHGKIENIRYLIYAKIPRDAKLSTAFDCFLARHKVDHARTNLKLPIVLQCENFLRTSGENLPLLLQRHRVLCAVRDNYAALLRATACPEYEPQVNRDCTEENIVGHRTSSPTGNGKEIPHFD